MAANPEQQRISSSVKPFLVTQHGLLYQTDCLELLARLRDESVDCIFADPPFNIGKNYKNGFNDQLHQEHYYTWCDTWIQECARVLKPGGAFFIYALPAIAIRFAQSMGQSLSFRHWIAVMMKGTFSRGKKLYPAHYGLLYYTKGEPKTFNRVRLPIPLCRHCGGEIRDYGGHRDKLNPEGLNLTDFWDDTSPNRHKKFKVRPGVNELKLMIPERAILLSTDPGDLVLDPFGGGGSTYQAAERHHRNWIGSELHDCHHIQTRLTEGFPLSVRRKPAFTQKSLFQTTHEDNHYTVLRRRQG